MSGCPSSSGTVRALAGEQLFGGFCLSLSAWCVYVACDKELFQQLKLLRARAAGRVQNVTRCALKAQPGNGACSS